MAFIFLQIQSPPIRKFPRQINSLRIFQRGLIRLSLTLSMKNASFAGWFCKNFPCSQTALAFFLDEIGIWGEMERKTRLSNAFQAKLSLAFRSNCQGTVAQTYCNSKLPMDNNPIAPSIMTLGFSATVHETPQTRAAVISDTLRSNASSSNGLTMTCMSCPAKPPALAALSA